MQCYIPKNAQPKCFGYTLDTTPSSDVTKKAEQNDLAWSVGNSIIRSRSEKVKIPTWAPYNSQVLSLTHQLTTVSMMPLLAAPAHEWSTMLTVLMQAQKITAVVMGENHKTVITFDLQLYEKAVKLQMHKAPDLDHLVFRIGEMHTIMASLRALGASIDGSGFDEGWIEAGLYGSTTTRQILEGNHMKRALTAHSITYSALSDLHMEAFLKSESAKSNAEHNTVYDSVIQASVAMNTICKEGQYSELGTKHKDLVMAMETDDLQERLLRFDEVMEFQCPLFKFARDYMKFVMCILMFIRASREGDWNLHLESLKALAKYFFAYDRLNYARMVPLYLAQMHRLKIDDIHHEFTQGNFCVNKNEIPFCAIGPDHAIEHINKLMKSRGGLKGLTQQPAAMARWFLVAPELSRLATQAEHMVGVQRASSPHHHDLSDAITKRYNENVQKLKDVLKVSDPFATEERHLVNIITKAVMPDDIKEGVLTRDKIGQALFATFAQERIVEAKLSVWSPMKKANLKSWKSAWQKNKNKTTCGVAPLKDDRALFARFLVVILSRPDLDIKETISTFELAEYPRALFFSDGSLRHCAAKSKLMNILESLLPAQQQPQTSTVQPHSADPSSRQVVIIDAMAVV